MQFDSRNKSTKKAIYWKNIKNNSQREIYDVKFAGSINYVDGARFRMKLKMKIIV